MNGVIVIDKPEDFTSFDVVAVVRRETRQRKTGHTGTLDPNATGVLPILLGSATKAQDIILNHDKSYLATFKLGIVSDTLDIWGDCRPFSEKKVEKTEILSLIPEFTGEIEQIPPMYSAIKINGQRLYDLARQGVEVERKSRKVTVYSLKLTSFDEAEQTGTLEIECSKGTYVRTIIDDIGRKLGTGAVMTSLRRTKACGYSLEDCISLDTLKELCESGEIADKIKSPESLFAELEMIAVSQAQAKRFANGGALDISRTALAKKDFADGDIFRVGQREGGFLGLGIADKEANLLKIYKLFPN